MERKSDPSDVQLRGVTTAYVTWEPCWTSNLSFSHLNTAWLIGKEGALVNARADKREMRWATLGSLEVESGNWEWRDGGLYQCERVKYCCTAHCNVVRWWALYRFYHRKNIRQIQQMKWRSAVQSLIPYLFIAFLSHVEHCSTPLWERATNRKVTWCFVVRGLKFIPQCSGVMELLLEMEPSNKRLHRCAGINAVLRGLLLTSLSFFFEKMKP